MRRTLLRRLENVETMALPLPPDTMALFVETVDGSSPQRRASEPECFAGRPPLGEVVAVHAGLDPSRRVERKPGESVQRLEARAAKLLPDVRVWWFDYGSPIR